MMKAVRYDRSTGIAANYPLTAVPDAYRALADRKTHGRIVLHPQDLG
jgi:NADPH2:quinone reductase